MKRIMRIKSIMIFGGKIADYAKLVEEQRLVPVLFIILCVEES